MKKSVGFVLLAAVATCAATSYAKKPIAQAKSIVLPLSDARAACDVAIEYVFFKHTWHRAEIGEAQRAKLPLGKSFLESYDNIGREITPTSTLAKLRQEGLNVCPAWAEKKRRAEKKWVLHNAPETSGGC